MRVIGGEFRSRRLLSPPDMNTRPTPDRLRDDFMRIDTIVSTEETALVEPTFQTVRKLEPSAIDSRVAWQRGEVVFQGEPLEQVLSEVGRYTTTQFVIGDDRLPSAGSQQ